MTKVYGLAVTLVICVIGEEKESQYWHSRQNYRIPINKIVAFQLGPLGGVVKSYVNPKINMG